MENQNREKIRYDIAISNPPYFKLQKSDERASAVNLVVHGQPNIYSIFLYLAATLLENGGQVIFIVPRSFTSGFYFKLFREKFFSQIQLNHIHLFGSRRVAFSRYEVLQENVIVSGKLRRQNGHRSMLAVSFSEGLQDLQHTRATEFYSDELLDMNSRQKILYLPLNKNEAEIIRLFKSWKGNLNKYNIQVSTGPVVAFRAKKYICTHPQNEISFAPLFWLHNIYKMKISWPLNKDGKGEYIQIGTPSIPLLIPNKNYIFLRRFSAKDDRSRLIAAPYYFNASNSDLIGVENHLNYIYRPNGHLEKNEMLGLAALLNSTLFDTYFRTFNGNINVSATEIRGIPLPPIETIKGIGDALLFKSAFAQEEIDEVVNHFLTREKMESVSYGIMAFISKNYARHYAPNTRETFRRQVLHQFVQARIADYNPDNPNLPVNSPNAHYAISTQALKVIQTFGTKRWVASVISFKAKLGELKKKYRQERSLTHIPLRLSDGRVIKLSPGKHNQVQVAIVNHFASRFAIGAILLYLGDAAKKNLYMDPKILQTIGVPIDQHGKLPDVIVYDRTKNWLYLIEAVTSHGPITPKRIIELEELLKNCGAGRVYVSAFPDFAEFKRHISELAWKTEVWIAEHPDH